jgi:ribonuclease D
VAEQVKAAQRVLKKAQSESAQRLGELVEEYEAARASLDELREQVARIERESRIREEVEVASKVVEIFAREEEEIIAILEIIDEMDSRALLAAVGIAA